MGLDITLEEKDDFIKNNRLNYEPVNENLLTNEEIQIYNDALNVDIDSNIGSYSRIHYLRQFAFYIEQLNTTEKITVKQVEEIIVNIDIEGVLDYQTSKSFNNLCDHSDYDGYYLPTLNRIDFDHASSYLLLKELRHLESIGAMKIIRYKLDALNNIIINIFHNCPPKEISIKYDIVYNILDIYNKLKYYCISSIYEESVICFC